MRKVFLALLSGFAAGVLAVLVGWFLPEIAYAAFALIVGQTPVSNGTNTNVLNITSGKLGQVSPSTTVNGTTCTLGSTCTITAGASSLTINSTSVSGSTGGDILYADSSHVLQNLAPTNCTGNNHATQYNSSTPAFTCVTDVANLDVADQTVSGGANITASNLGTVSSGTTTIDCGTVQLQYLTNGGAFTLAAPANDGNCLVLTTNNGSAGTITFSGFAVGANTGDALDTTNTHKFTIFIWRINAVSGYRIAAHQ